MMDNDLLERLRKLEQNEAVLHTEVEHLKEENAQLKEDIRDLKSGIGKGLWLVGSSVIGTTIGLAIAFIWAKVVGPAQ